MAFLSKDSRMIQPLDQQERAPTSLRRKAVEYFHAPRLPGRVLRAWDRMSLYRRRQRINAMLKTGRRQAPQSVSYEAACALHHEYPIRDSYRYDEAAKNARAEERYVQISSFVSLPSVKEIGEVGAGDGRLALRFAGEGFRVRILEAEDWRDADVKNADIAYHQLTEDSRYPLPDDSLDLLLSYNTFEHIADPSAALDEMVRVTRPGGSIFLSFGPLYNSPFGLHAYRTYYAPYPQFLLDEDMLQRFVEENGIWDLGGARQQFQYVNGWSLQRYQTLFNSRSDRVDLRLFSRLRDFDHLDIVSRYPACFRGRALSFDEVTVSALEVLFAVK